MTLLPIPSALLPPPERLWTIQTQRERQEKFMTLGLFGCGGIVHIDWGSVDRSGDLLYVGYATRSLNSRLHPGSHAMWSTVWGQELFPRVRIAIWGVPLKDCKSVEASLVDSCAPLASGTIFKGAWAWRDPDVVLLPTAFHPYLREPFKPPFRYRACGVYAWLLAPTKPDAGWVRRVMLEGAEMRRVRRAKMPPLLDLDKCLACRAFYDPGTLKRRCKACGRTLKEAEAVELQKMEAALGYED